MKKATHQRRPGQDGAYLSEFLLDMGYDVHGIKRRTSLFNTDRIDHLYRNPHDLDQRVVLHHGDMPDSPSLVRIIQPVQPDEISNLAVRSHVAVSLAEMGSHPEVSLAVCLTQAVHRQTLRMVVAVGAIVALVAHFSPSRLHLSRGLAAG